MLLTASMHAGTQGDMVHHAPRYLPPPELDFDQRRVGAAIRKSIPVVVLLGLVMAVWMLGVELWHWDVRLALELGVDPTSTDLGLALTVLPVLACVVLLLCLPLWFVFEGYVPRSVRHSRRARVPRPCVRADHPAAGDHRPPRATRAA